jgi:transcriptional regulator with XRE-family HTH domain
MTGDVHLPFDVTLRRAIDARGLSLDRIAKRLHSAGTPVSPATLSYWQRGRSIPITPSSRRAVEQLEAILELSSGALTSALAPNAGRSRRMATRQGLISAAAERLRASFGTTGSDTVTMLRDECAFVSPTEFREDVRLTIRATRAGVDRAVIVLHPDADDQPTVEAGPVCHLGGTRHDSDTGLLAVELTFDAPLTRGETYPVAYRVTSRATDSRANHEGYAVAHTRPGLKAYSLTLDFDPTITPTHIYRVWREDADQPHKRLADLRLLEGRYAHLWVPDPLPGSHGIRWETAHRA